MFGRQLWYEFGNKSAGFLWIQITDFFRNIYQRCSDLIMTLLRTFFISTSSSTDLHRKLLTSCLSHKLSWLFLHILGCAGRLIHSPTLLRSLTITHLLYRLVAFLHRLIVSLLLESDGALLFKVFLTNLLHGRFKLCNISVMT